MELINYWKVVKRRWLLIIVPAVVVLIFGIATYQPPTTTYNVGIQYLVSQPPSEAAETQDEARYYNWLASEYIVNGLADWTTGNLFKTAVSQQLATQGIEVPASAIGVVADNVRSKLVISITYHDPEILAAMIEAVTVVLQEQNANALPQIDEETAVLIQPLDEPIINPISAGIRSQLDLPLRFIAALLAGFGLAFIVEYLDPTIKERAELQTIGFEILGEIPKK
ncbi:MAG: hypothetical protein AAF490_10025 [Chloroflexota bacterium]